MRELQLRFPLALGDEVYSTVFSGGEERVAFCLVSHVEVDGVVRLLVRRVVTLDDDDYGEDGAGVTWRGSAMLPIIETAMNENLGVIFVHAHALAPPRLSRVDLESAKRLIPLFQRRVPGRPHGSIVFARRAASGLVALPGSVAEEVDVSVRWLGRTIVDWKSGERASNDEAFDSQILVVGEQSVLTSATVAVVGLSGGGSHVVQQLAHVGAGTIIGVDPDACDSRKLHRIMGMRRFDGIRESPKTSVMNRLVTEMDSGTKFVGVPARVPSAAAISALIEADVIVGCVDNLHAREAIQELAWRHLIPFVDVGVSIRAVKRARASNGPRVVVAGNVLVLIPGGFCMWCCDFLTEDALAAERIGPNASYFRDRSGEAQVASFNGLVASQAVTETIQLVSGFAGDAIAPTDLRTADAEQRGYLKLDGVRGTLEEWGARRSPTCPRCAAHLAAGTVIWEAVGADAGSAA